MTFSNRMSTMRLPQNELQAFEEQLLGQHFWAAYFDKVWRWMLLYHNKNHSVQPKQMSDVSDSLKNYFEELWQHFFTGHFPDSLDELAQKVETLFSNITIWERWCELYDFLEYTNNEMILFENEAEKQQFVEDYIEHEIYAKANGKLTPFCFVTASVVWNHFLH
jgi:hypothetical protein